MKTGEVIGMVLAAVGIIIAAMQWMISNAIKKGAVNQKVDDVHEKVKSYDNQSSRCEKRFIQLENKVELGGFDQTTKRIIEKIDVIEKFLIAKNPDQLNTFSVTRSPRQLSDTGRRLFEKSGADKILDEHKAALIAQMDSELLATAYDVEQYAYRTLIGATSEPWFNPLKEFVYNSPVFEANNITIATVCFVMGLELRNEYLKIHPEVVDAEG